MPASFTARSTPSRIWLAAVLSIVRLEERILFSVASRSSRFSDSSLRRKAGSRRARSKSSSVTAVKSTMALPLDARMLTRPGVILVTAFRINLTKIVFCETAATCRVPAAPCGNRYAPPFPVPVYISGGDLCQRERRCAIGLSLGNFSSAQNHPEKQMSAALPPIRRVVTGHDANGVAKVLIDGPATNVRSSRPGSASTLMWSTDGMPADIASGENVEDCGARKLG